MWEVTLKRFLKNYINTLIVTSRQGEKIIPGVGLQPIAVQQETQMEDFFFFKQ